MINKLKKPSHPLWVMLAVLSLVAAACGSSDDPASDDTAGDESSSSGQTTDDDSSSTEQDTSTDSEEAVTLSLIMEEVPDTDIVQGLLDDFSADHPNISIEIEALPYDSMRDRIITSSLAPNPTYDVVIIDNPWMVDFANGGFISPLDDYITATDGYDYDDFAAPLREIGEVDGVVYGVPFYNYALGLIYRTDLIDEPPATITEYETLVADITAEGDLNGLAMQPQRGYKVFEEWANWLYSYNGTLTDEAGNVVLDSPEARAALQAYVDTYESAAPDASLNWGFDEALRSVASGEAATMISYNWMLPTLNNPDGPAGDLAGSFALAEMPGGTSVLGSWHWAIAPNTEKADAAWDFISWVSSNDIETQRAISGGAPTRLSVLENPDVWEQGFGQDYYETVAAILENGIPLAAGPNAEEVINVVGTHLNAAVAGEESVDEAIADAASGAADTFGQG